MVLKDLYTICIQPLNCLLKSIGRVYWRDSNRPYSLLATIKLKSRLGRKISKISKPVNHPNQDHALSLPFECKTVYFYLHDRPILLIDYKL